MDILLTDLLTCPRCGPAHGLILLPGEVRDRRVVSGVLGCANCRERYAVEAGVADLRGEGGEGVPGGGGEGSGAGGGVAGAGGGSGSGEAGGDGAAAVRLAALLGLSETGGVVLLTGPAAALAEGVAALVSGTAVVTSAEGGVEWGGASRLRLGSVLPLRTGSLRGVALTGSWAGLVEEGARLVAPAGRLVLDPAPEDARARVEARGLRVLVEESGVLVAGRRG